MGKYMKKSKAGEVAVMEVSQTHQPPLGVRTRSRTLALQNNSHSSENNSAKDYLQLRSRRLEKPPAPKPKSFKNEKIAKETRKSWDFGLPEESTAALERVEENYLETDARSRYARETTPCSLIRDSDNVSTPGSTTKPSSSTASNRRTQNSMLHNIPTTDEMEEFFAGAEQFQQQKFVEKYNFDPVNGHPLPGRYEWVQVDS